ncbi:MAG: SGNH/GDSL hydrolase family protein [Clostridiales bacterium]|nr:SGNH/GDSL hydrolase family protein [Clostridiales bacterium]
MGKLITILGDSIARGLMYDSKASRYTVYPDTYASKLKGLGYSLKNLARVGGTIDNALEMFEKCEKQPGGRLAIELGGNDSDLDWKEVAKDPGVYHEAKIPLKEFGEKLYRLISLARKSGLKPLVVTPLPVVAERYVKWISHGLDAEKILKYLGSYEYIYRWQERYALEALKTALATDTEVFDLRSQFLFQRDFADFMCEDGIHPNSAGHELIAQAVCGYVLSRA